MAGTGGVTRKNGPQTQTWHPPSQVLKFSMPLMPLWGAAHSLLTEKHLAQTSSFAVLRTVGGAVGAGRG